jgi:asparagine synthase (glutamine-hydrolysing)
MTGKKFGMDSPNHMNPFDYWYNTNEQFRKFIQDYYIENIDKIGSYYNLKNALIEQMKIGTTNEKLQVLSILAMFKQYELV